MHKDALRSTVTTEKNGETVLHLYGMLDERSAAFLPALPEHCHVVDLSKVTRVNSLGADHWIRWIHRHQGATRDLRVRHMNPSFVRTLNAITDLIPSSWLIESFYVPHVGASTGQNVNVLFLYGEHFTKSEVLLAPELVSGDGEQKLELDVDPSRYFRFLQTRFPALKIAVPTPAAS